MKLTKRRRELFDVRAIVCRGDVGTGGKSRKSVQAGSERADQHEADIVLVERADEFRRVERRNVRHVLLTRRTD